MNSLFPKRINVIGSQYSSLKKEDVQRELFRLAKEKKSGYVCVSNVHTTMMGFFDPSYQQITNESLFAVPDGVPLVWAMRSFGALDQDRVRGPSLMRDLLDKGRVQGFKHYLYGGSSESLRQLKEKIQKEYPGALIVGAESPPFRAIEEVPSAEWKEIAERINSCSPDFIWVGIGAPKQEMWMWKQRSSVKGIMFGVGAAFDLIPGIVPEAPLALQALGLEWLYRFLKEPRRLWRRYLFNNPAFLILWAAQLCGITFGQSRSVGNG